MATRQKRNVRIPSSSHRLVLLASNKHGARIKASRNSLEKQRLVIESLAGFAGADWAIKQLTTLPEIVRPGWPAKPSRRRKAHF